MVAFLIKFYTNTNNKKMFILYNCAHKHAAIKSSGDAWIRILGFFQKKDDAMNYAKTVSSVDNGLEIRIAPSNEFRMLLSCKYKDTNDFIDMDTRVMESQKLQDLLELHNNHRKQAFEDTANNAKNHTVGDVKFNPIEKIDEYKYLLQVTPENNTQNSLSVVKPISSNFNIRMQRFAAIAAIPDYLFYKELENKLTEWEKNKESTEIQDLKEWYTNNPLPNPTGAEPAVSFLMYAETEDEMNSWIKNKCTLKDVDIACVSMYEWIKVNNIWSDSIKRIYRESLVEKLHFKKNYQHQESLKLEGKAAKEIIITN